MFRTASLHQVQETERLNSTLETENKGLRQRVRFILAHQHILPD